MTRILMNVSKNGYFDRSAIAQMASYVPTEIKALEGIKNIPQNFNGLDEGIQNELLISTRRMLGYENVSTAKAKKIITNLLVVSVAVENIHSLAKRKDSIKTIRKRKRG